MQDITTTALTLLHSTPLFRLQLLILLASLLLSLLLNKSFPYFAVSGTCFLTSLTSLSLAIFSTAKTETAYFDITTTAAFTLILLGTGVYAVARRSEAGAVRWHAGSTLACAMVLVGRACWILWGAEGTERTKLVDRCTLIATGFAATHLLSALLMLYDATSLTTTMTQTRNDDDNSDEKGGDMV